MTTYTTISNASVAVGGIPSSTTVTALRDNPSAIAEAATGAPIVAAGWHPVDKVTIGDGKTGIIYDSAITGTVSSVVTADFEDGYEYRMVGMDLNHSDTVTARSYQLSVLKNGTWVNSISIGAVGNNTECSFDMTVVLPRVSSEDHIVQYTAFEGTVLSGTFGFIARAAGAAKITQARVQFVSANIVKGKVWLFRRREYASLA